MAFAIARLQLRSGNDSSNISNENNFYPLTNVIPPSILGCMTRTPAMPRDEHGKVCTGCETYKPYSDYNPNKKYKDGRIARCKPCQNQTVKAIIYPQKYGITLDDYEAMLSKQLGVCALCFQPPGARALHVDHCHTTGRVRALLCHGCNTGLGSFQDSPALLRDAARYLERFRQNETKN